MNLRSRVSLSFAAQESSKQHSRRIPFYYITNMLARTCKFFRCKSKYPRNIWPSGFKFEIFWLHMRSSSVSQLNILELIKALNRSIYIDAMVILYVCRIIKNSYYAIPYIGNFILDVMNVKLNFSCYFSNQYRVWHNFGGLSIDPNSFRSTNPLSSLVRQLVWEYMPIQQCPQMCYLQKRRVSLTSCTNIYTSAARLSHKT